MPDDPGGSGPETRPRLRPRDEVEPEIGHPTAADRSLAAFATGGGIRSRDVSEAASPGVTRWRKKPIDVDMIRWDGSDEAWQLIANHGGLPEHLPDGSINIWVEASQAEMNLDQGAWAVIEPDGSGVYPCRAADHATTYEPAGSPDPAGDEDQGDADDGRVTVSREDLQWAMGLKTLTAATADRMRAAQARIVAAAAEADR